MALGSTKITVPAFPGHDFQAERGTSFSISRSLSPNAGALLIL